LLVALHYLNTLDWHAHNGRLPLLGLVAFGVLGSLIAIGTLLRPPKLILTSDGFTFQSGLATRHQSWDDIDQFLVVDRFMIEYWYSDTFTGPTPKAALLNVFEPSSVDLASLLSSWHAEHRAKASNQPLHPDALTRAGERRR
jgi:hypothetical protein